MSVNPIVGIVMGSDSDWPVMEAAADALAEFDVPVEVDVQAEGRLPELVESTAYFAVAESLANIAKHSQAKSVLLTLEVGAGQLSVVVRDDGVGIDESRIETAKSHGLLGMRHRIESLDGSLSIRSLGSGVGTEVRFVLPIERIQGTGTEP